MNSLTVLSTVLMSLAIVSVKCQVRVLHVSVRHAAVTYSSGGPTVVILTRTIASFSFRAIVGILNLCPVAPRMTLR